jgi:hypothetical protein
MWGLQLAWVDQWIETFDDKLRAAEAKRTTVDYARQ